MATSGTVLVLLCFAFAAIGVVLSKKSGLCPPSETLAECPTVPGHECASDGDCSGNLKCCMDFCDLICVVPILKPTSPPRRVTQLLNTSEPPPTPAACGCKDGPPGRDGRDGKTVIGPPGPPGLNGVDGTKGRDGRDGQMGKSGPKGDKGNQGLPGLQGIQGPPGRNCDNANIKKDINDLRARVIELESKTSLMEDLRAAIKNLQKQANETRDRLHGEIKRIENVIKKVNDSQIPGPPGLRGPKAKGNQGPQSIMGKPGARGPPGLRGSKGDSGDKGERGPMGSKGEKGSSGADAIAGCQHIVIKSRSYQVHLNGPTRGHVIVGVSCASEGRPGAANLKSFATGGYACSCKSRYGRPSDKRWLPGTNGTRPHHRPNWFCVLHYWQCPFSI